MDRLATCLPRMSLDLVGGYPRLTLHGECGAKAATELNERMERLISHGYLSIMLDTRDVSFLDGEFHDTLVRTIARVREAGGAFVIIDQSPPVERILKLMNLEQLSCVVPTVGQAATYLRSRH
jgi:anti-anti-sigma factor